MPKTIAQYSTEELVEIMVGLDREKHPEKYRKIAQAIDERMEGILEQDEKRKQALIEKSESLSDSMTLGKSVLYILLSMCLSILPLRYLISGEVNKLHHTLTMEENPIRFWMAVVTGFLAAAIPLLLVIKGLLKNS